MASPIVNDFTIAVATVNGSGSASSNTILAKTVFRMGVPVAAKNLFPSNISGLPTWYLVRLSEDGWQCRTGRHEITVALNPATAAVDIKNCEPGGVLLIDAAMPQAKSIERDDITVLKVPMIEIAKALGPDPRLRKLLANMVYVGVIAELVGLDPKVLDEVVADQFARKDKVVKLNLEVMHAGRKWASENADAAACPFRVETRDLTRDKIIIEGNTAAALGALMGGATFCGWYPITPSTSVCESFIDLCKKHRVDEETGEARFAAIQGEDELASIGLVLGAGWAGARSFTATSGPGVSLMGELVGFGYYAEIPGVIIDVQRVGPSTGMPTRTQQSDLTTCYRLSHGDTEHLLLLPSGAKELYEMTQQAFDLAERYQTPVFLLSDLDMGMNAWVADRFEYPTQGFDRGKVLDKEALEQVEEFHRYADPDGDGVPYRTLPGTHHPKAPYFTRGSGHTSEAEYTEKADEYKEVLDRIKRKIRGSTAHTPAPVIEGEGDIGLIHFGSSSAAVDEARHVLAKQGLKTRSLRLRALPVHDEVLQFIKDCKTLYVVEQNRDAQLADILRLELPDIAGKIQSILEYGGLPMPAKVVIDALRVGSPEPAHV